MPTPRAALLDVDGTLLDTNDLHARAWHDALSSHGYEVSFERIRSLIGMGGDKVLPELTGLSEDSEAAKPIKAARKRIFFADCLPQAHAFAGTRELLIRMRDQGLKMVVASSASRDELDALLRQGQIADLLPDTTSADDAEHSKPDPDIVQAALKKAGVSAHEALMIGDTPYDVEAASRAGVRIIALRSGGWDDRSLHGALAVYAHPMELLTQYHASALAC